MATSSNVVKATATVKETVSSNSLVSNIVSGGIDGITDITGKSLLLELVSAHIHPSKLCSSNMIELFKLYLYPYIFLIYLLL